MEWYLPITILPGVGLLIQSTTAQMQALSLEINDLLSVKCSTFQHEIADRKISQLGRLTKSATLLYLSAACFVLSGIVGALGLGSFEDTIPQVILGLGVGFVFMALGLLIFYGYRTIQIRKAQHLNNRKGH